jgi:hypothetical protein
VPDTDILSGDVARREMQLIVDRSSADFPDMALDAFGIRVKITDRCHVYITMMMFGNWRLLEVIPDNSPYEPACSYNRGWCFGGRGAFVAAFAAALRWDGAADTEPAGWVKAVHDQRRFGEPKPGIRQM